MKKEKNARDWFLVAVGLALIPSTLIQKTCTAAMDEKTPTHRSSVKFNDYVVSNYADSSSSPYSIELWNVHDALVKDLPQTNNHVEGYNSRLGSLFPVHPHIFRFIERLRDEHLFQRHLAEQSKVHPIKRKQITKDVNAQLRVLLNDDGIGEITDLELANLCRRTVKIRLIKWNIIFLSHMSTLVPVFSKSYFVSDIVLSHSTHKYSYLSNKIMHH